MGCALVKLNEIYYTSVNIASILHHFDIEIDARVYPSKLFLIRFPPQRNLSPSLAVVHLISFLFTWVHPGGILDPG